MPEAALAGIRICAYDLVDVAATRTDLPFLFNAERLFPCLVFHSFCPPFFMKLDCLKQIADTVTLRAPGPSAEKADRASA